MVNYQFENNVLLWAFSFCERMTGTTSRAFIILLSPNGAAGAVYFGQEDGPAPQSFRTLMETNESWVFYDPYDLPEWCWLGWKNLQHATFKRLTGEFPRDMAGNQALGEFPTTWGRKF
jgi:hypothetical protein